MELMHKRKTGGGDIAFYITTKLFLAISTLVVAMPLYSAVLNSFKETADIAENPFLPVNLTFENYKFIFTNPDVPLFEMYKNSIVITVCSVFLVLISAPLAGYYIARKNTRFSEIVLLFFLAGMMIPPQLTLIPLVKMFVSLKLIGTVYGMFLFYMGNNCAFAILLYSRFVKTIPYSLEESALLDGASQYKVFWRIIFPLLKPCTATLIIFLGLGFWNDFMTPLILLRGTLTITMGIRTAIGPYSAEWGHIFGFVMVSAAPLLILFLFMQDWFINGLTAGAVKS